METSRYSFDNDDPAAAERHVHLATMGDPFTFERLSAAGPLGGLRCLEVGAGGGSVAEWLATRAGPDGHVLATDLNPRHLRPGRGYAMLRHDLVTEPVPEPPWDLVHARMVLSHLPQRVEILGRLAAALAPGGLLLIEEWAPDHPGLVLAAPDAAATALVDRYHEVLVKRLLPANGHSPQWAGRVHATMLAAGLVDVDTRIRSESWAGGTAGALIHAVNVEQLRPGLLDAGFTEQDLGRLSRLAADPRLVVRSHFSYSTLGRRPAS